ncbi:hypothetical protein H2203_002037 [Taxawa tesnikishii (nom. ined.)]|nr:hypothetical protein H2203_002037 [Dothideales sp. JES 119]
MKDKLNQVEEILEDRLDKLEETWGDKLDNLEDKVDQVDLKDLERETNGLEAKVDTTEDEVTELKVNHEHSDLAEDRDEISTIDNRLRNLGDHDTQSDGMHQHLLGKPTRLEHAPPVAQAGAGT